ncbi:MAG: GerAB/ArcD/ProY family transporter [Heliobacteriaceae bacterium]|nr:GerAB/ArcD/ProY family transporter [Heliobacteriaceae bacterium]
MPHTNHMKRELISPLEVWAVFTSFYIGTRLFISPSIEITGTDAWLSDLVTILPALLFVPLLVLVHRYYPHQSLIISARTAFGRFFGTLFSFFWVWLPLYLGAMVLRFVADFLIAMIYPMVSPGTLNILAISVATYAAWLGPEVIARFALLLLPWLILGLAGMIFLALPLLDVCHLLPLFQASAGDFLRQMLNLGTYPFAEAILLITLLTYTPQQADPKKPVIWAVVTCLIIFALRDFVTIGIFGSSLSAKVLFPFFAVVRAEQLGVYLDRLDVSFVLVWLCFSLIKLTICLFLAARHLAEWAGFPDYRTILPPVTLFGLGFSLLIWRNFLGLSDFLDKIYPIFLLPWAIGYPVLLIIRAKQKQPSG